MGIDPVECFSHLVDDHHAKFGCYVSFRMGVGRIPQIPGMQGPRPLEWRTTRNMSLSHVSLCQFSRFTSFGTSVCKGKAQAITEIHP